MLDIIKKKRILIIAAPLFVFLLLCLSCSEKESPTAPTESRFPLAEENNIDPIALGRAFDAAVSDRGIKCLLLARNNVLIAEEYFYQDGPDSLYHVRSVTKSVTSALFGMAMKQGMITNLDTTVADFLTNYTDTLDPVTGSISIRNLLTMSGGFEWDEFTNFNQFNRWMASQDHVKFVLDLPIQHTPGTVFTYNTAACQLLSAIFTKATGYTLKEFAETFFYPALNIEGVRPWTADERGLNYGGVYLSLTPMDMLKFGLLYVNGGIYNNTQLIDSDWIELSSQSWFQTGPGFLGSHSYGFLWWIGGEGMQRYFFANGYGGQFIFGLPELNAVIVARSDWQYTGGIAEQQWVNTIQIIINRVIPAINY